MTQMLAVAIAAFFLGLGMAGEPFAPLHALLALVVLLLIAMVLGPAVRGQRSSHVIVFLFGLTGVLFACYLQHREIYPGTGIVGVGLGVLAASSLGRRTAPAFVAALGTVVGTGLFFLL